MPQSAPPLAKLMHQRKLASVMGKNTRPEKPLVVDLVLLSSPERVTEVAVPGSSHSTGEGGRKGMRGRRPYEGESQKQHWEIHSVKMDA